MSVRVRLLATGVCALGGAALLAWAWTALGPQSVMFAFLAVWIPMACFALVGEAVSLRLPDAIFAEHGWERGGRVYELVGVRVAKRLLRRGPLHVFARHMQFHDEERTRSDVRALARGMREAETTHGVQFVVMAAVSVGFAASGWWGTAAWMTLFNVVVNGYPSILQRYNRILLGRRFSGWFVP